MFWHNKEGRKGNSVKSVIQFAAKKVKNLLENEVAWWHGVGVNVNVKIKVVASKNKRQSPLKRDLPIANDVRNKMLAKGLQMQCDQMDCQNFKNWQRLLKYFYLKLFKLFWWNFAKTGHTVSNNLFEWNISISGLLLKSVCSDFCWHCLSRQSFYYQMTSYVRVHSILI